MSALILTHVVTLGNLLDPSKPVYSSVKRAQDKVFISEGSCNLSKLIQMWQIEKCLACNKYSINVSYLLLQLLLLSPYVPGTLIISLKNIILILFEHNRCHYPFFVQQETGSERLK